jgi:cell division protein FtsW
MSAAGTADGSLRSAFRLDPVVLGCALALLAIGLVMVASASIAVADRVVGSPFYYLLRQGAYVGIGLSLAALIVTIPLRFWEVNGPALFMGALLLLVAVLMPGLGRQVNGSQRWLAIGPFQLQVSEVMKFALVPYLAGYLVRHGVEVRRSAGSFLRAVGLLALIGVLLLMEPDFGAVVVMASVAFGMLFLGGAPLWPFGMGLAGGVAALAGLAIASPYRLQRLTTFLDPWADPFTSGFQLTQALIAFGRGEWFGVGLGGSVQKLFYLPEAHTDFLFAVLAEELGFAGVAVVLILFGVLVWRAFAIARRAGADGRLFGSYCAYGVGLWLGLQAFINIGVNMGVLPTKGLTLPLMSYGGSSLLASCAAVALLLRIDLETPGGKRIGG